MVFQFLRQETAELIAPIHSAPRPLAQFLALFLVVSLGCQLADLADEVGEWQREDVRKEVRLADADSVAFPARIRLLTRPLGRTGQARRLPCIDQSVGHRRKEFVSAL